MQRVATLRAQRDRNVQRSVRAVGEFETTRPTPLQSENDEFAMTGDVIMLKQWDLAPVDPQSFDPTEPPGRPGGGPPPDTDEAPVNTAPPTITQAGLVVGDTATGDTGTWTGSPTPTLASQWTKDGTAIAGETGASYTFVVGDVDAMIGLTVTATNTEGDVTADAAAVGPVTAAEAFRRR